MNCEERYGQQQVEWLLDAAHALMHQGVHRYPHAKVRDLKAEAEREAERRAHRERVYNDLWRTLPIEQKHEPSQEDDRRTALNLPQENILYFLEKSAPLLQPWQREILRIIRLIAQYFYPQMQTKVMNEGCATYCHYRIMTRLHEKGQITDGAFMEFLQSHRSEEHTSELQSLMRISYAVFCLKKKTPMMFLCSVQLTTRTIYTHQ